MRTISLNTHYSFLEKDPRDRTVVSRLASQVFSEKVPDITELFGDATEKTCAFLLIDMQAETPGNYEHNNGRPMVVYSSNCVKLPFPLSCHLFLF